MFSTFVSQLRAMPLKWKALFLGQSAITVLLLAYRVSLTSAPDPLDPDHGVPGNRLRDRGTGGTYEREKGDGGEVGGRGKVYDGPVERAGRP